MFSRALVSKVESLALYNTIGGASGALEMVSSLWLKDRTQDAGASFRPAALREGIVLGLWELGGG